MEIQKVEISFWKFVPFATGFTENLRHVKSLPYLSIVQATKGYYEIGLDDSILKSTGEGGFFIAPAMVRQDITHHLSKNEGRMCARWLFLDARINDKYTLDELYSFPAVIDAESGKIMDECFDSLESSDDYCGKMSIIYRLIGLLINFAEHEKTPESNGVVNAIKYIHSNYMRKITVGELAKIANMSESNLYAAFRKKYGDSPLDYLNRLRLSVAFGMLETTHTPIETVAISVGIPDAFYFSKLFKKAFGVPPREFRKQRQIT